MVSSGAHEFVLFVPEGLPGQAGNIQEIHNEEVMHRLKQVLRVVPNECVVFFNETHWMRAKILGFATRSVRISICTSAEISAQTPPITALVPLLEKEALERLFSFALMMGVTTILPVITRKTHRVKLEDKERERLRRVMIAAAEQSKQFLLPKVERVLPLAEALSLLKSGKRLFFDPVGLPAATLFSQKSDSYVVMVGPEGDLVEDEKELLRMQGFVFCRLTPAVLRSEYAFLLGCGMLRSLV